MSTNSVIEHRANYYFVKLHEEYLLLCENNHCQALILSVMEEWTNTKKAKNQSLYIHMTYPQWITALYGMYGRNIIMKALGDLEQKGLLEKRPYKCYGKDSFEYVLKIQLLNKLLKDLPDKMPQDILPDINAFKKGRVLISTRLKKDGIDEGAVPKRTDDAFKKGRNIESITQNLLHINSMSERSNDISLEQTADAANSLALPADLTFDEIALITKIIEERRHTPSQEEPEGIEQTTPIQEPPPTVEETSREASSLREKSGKTSKSVTKQRVLVLPTAEPSSGALAILIAWRNVVWGSSSNKETPRTKENLEAAEELARIGATEDDLRKVRDRLNGQPDGWWKRRGVKLKNIANHFDLAAPSGERGKTDYNEVAGMTDEQRVAYRRQQQEKQKQALPPGVDREALMKLPPEERIAVLKKLREQQPVSA